MNCEATQEKFTLPITSLLFRNLVWFGADAHRVNTLTPGFQSGGAQVRGLSQVQWGQDAPWEMLLRCGTLIPADRFVLKSPVLFVASRIRLRVKDIEHVPKNLAPSRCPSHLLWPQPRSALCPHEADS